MDLPVFTLSNFFGLLWLFFIRGGWILFLIMVAYMAWYLYFHEIKEQFVESQQWTFLSIKGPKENLTSTLAVEQIFHQLHVLYVGLTFAQRYVEGMQQLWYSLEIISMGGKVSVIMRVPKNKAEFVKSAIYAGYPDAEVQEVEDYMKNVQYDPEDGDLELFGTEFKLGEKQYLPIKTYKDFEHTTAEQKIVDPLAPLFEGMAKIEPWEFYGVQILAQPTQDEEWKPAGERYVKSLTGEEVEHETGFLDLLLSPFNWFAHFSFKKAITSSGGHGHGEETQKNQKNDWMSMTDVEKERVNLAQKKMGKSGFKCKIRHLYLAPRDKFNKDKRSHFIGAFRTFGTAQSNKLKPDVSNTWTGVDYIISPTLEKPYIDWLQNIRKKFIFAGYKHREMHIGLPPFILNAEELATIFHWPLTTSAVFTPSVEQVESKKAQPPVNLPV